MPTSAETTLAELNSRDVDSRNERRDLRGSMEPVMLRVCQREVREVSVGRGAAQSWGPRARINSHVVVRVTVRFVRASIAVPVPGQAQHMINHSTGTVPGDC